MVISLLSVYCVYIRAGSAYGRSLGAIKLMQIRWIRTGGENWHLHWHSTTRRTNKSKKNTCEGRLATFPVFRSVSGLFETFSRFSGDVIF